LCVFGQLTRLVPRTLFSKHTHTKKKGRISKRHNNFIDSEADARRSQALSSVSSVRSMLEASFSMANAAPNALIPAFVASLDGCVIGRQPDEGETRPARDLCQDEIDFDILMGVFDGHGPDGHVAASLCASDLVSVIRDEQDVALKQGHIELALTEGIKALQRRLEETPPHRLDIDESGTTATIIFATPTDIYLANLGDSRAIAGQKKTDGTFVVVDMSFDHLLSVESEMQRVVAHGGRVMPVLDSRGRAVGPPRAWLQNKDVPGLMVSRSLGDRIGKGIGVSAEPYVTHMKKANVAFVIAASDGLWEVMTGADAVAFVANAIGRHENLSEILCVEARRRWILQEGAVMDDISCVVLAFS